MAENPIETTKPSNWVYHDTNYNHRPHLNVEVPVKDNDDTDNFKLPEIDTKHTILSQGDGFLIKS